MTQVMTPAMRVHYSCRLCGATSYRSVFDRDVAGAIRPTTQYRCSGYALTFRDPNEWRSARQRVGQPA